MRTTPPGGAKKAAYTPVIIDRRRGRNRIARNKASPGNLIAVTEQWPRALELRKRGMSFTQIAKEIGWKAPSSAYKAVMEGIRRTLQEPADELRKIELERLDGMLKAIWPQVQKGNLFAIDRALNIQARRARYIGLDAPTKVDARTSSNQPLTYVQLVMMAEGQSIMSGLANGRRVKEITSPNGGGNGESGVIIDAEDGG